MSSPNLNLGAPNVQPTATVDKSDVDKIAQEILKQRENDSKVTKVTAHAFTDGFTWDRDEKGNWFTMIDNKKVALDNAENVKKYVEQAKNCYDTGLTNDNEKCRNILDGCLAGTANADKCKAALTGLTFGDIKDHIEKTHPRIITKFLKTLDFKQKGNGVESVEEWEKRNAGNSSFTANSGNVKIYLNNLVDFVNENAEWIDHKNHKNRSGNRIGKLDSVAAYEELNIGAYKESPQNNSQMHSAYLLGSLGTSFPTAPALFQNFGGITGLAMGGGHKEENLMKKNYEYLLARLRNKGKDLDITSQNKIVDLINAYTQNLKQLQSTLKVMSSYLYYLNVTSDNGNKEVTSDSMEKFNKKYSSTVSSLNNRTVTIFEILKVLEDLVDNKSTDGATLSIDAQ